MSDTTELTPASQTRAVVALRGTAGAYAIDIYEGGGSAVVVARDATTDRVVIALTRSGDAMVIVWRWSSLRDEDARAICEASADYFAVTA